MEEIKEVEFTQNTPSYLQRRVQFDADTAIFFSYKVPSAQNKHYVIVSNGSYQYTLEVQEHTLETIHQRFRATGKNKLSAYIIEATAPQILYYNREIISAAVNVLAVITRDTKLFNAPNVERIPLYKPINKGE